jgi:hypothetical protein
MKSLIADVYFNERKISGVDIKEHLDTLFEYAKQSDSIVELGVRYAVSTWAFILGEPKKLTCVDIVPISHYSGNDNILNHVENACKDLNIDFEFIVADDLEIELEPCDLLFIDTLHTYNQLTKELNLHGDKAKKWIIMHDTNMEELKFSIDGFLSRNECWEVERVYTNNNGLTILRRVR